MIEKINLTPYMRSLLLAEICKRMDIIDYCSCFYNFILKPDIKNIFTGNCPFCSGDQSFTINKTTGKIFCCVCKKEEDFLTLMGQKEDRDLNNTLKVLTRYLETKEKLKPKYSGGVI